MQLTTKKENLKKIQTGSDLNVSKIFIFVLGCLLWKICSSPNRVNVDYEKLQSKENQNKKDELEFQTKLQTNRAKGLEKRIEIEKRKKLNNIYKMIELFYSRVF